VFPFRPRIGSENIRFLSRLEEIMARSINWKSDDKETSMLRMKINRQETFKNERRGAESHASSSDAGIIIGPGFGGIGSSGDNLRDISVLKLALEKQEAVCQLNIGPSTGFLIAEDILITCNHVLPNSRIASLGKARFNLQLDEKRMPLTRDEYSLAPDRLFETDPELDITVVKVAGKPGAKSKWGFIRLARVFPEPGNSAIIIQHPSQLRYKKIALGDMEIKYVDSKEIQYLSDTLPGSSGSPIFNDDFKLIGVHRAGDGKPDDNKYFRNEGVHINAVIDFLESVGLGHIV
jgi:Trypsin-like peptidase domain